jgi:large subunit ribosomal protein L17
MRHGRAGYRLTRKTAHRTAMLRNLAAGIFEHGQIVTTIPKAKAVQPFVEQIVTLAKQGDLAARRRVVAKLGGDRHGFEWLFVAKKATQAEQDAVNDLRDRAKVFFDMPESKEVERNRYGELRESPRLVKHIFDHVGPKFADRTGGYTRIVRLGKSRMGDAAELCLLQFVGAEDGPEVGGNPSTRRRTADKRTAFLAKLRKG